MTVDLQGKCRELGYCDCGGAWGCIDTEPPFAKPAGRKGNVGGSDRNPKQTPYALCPACKRALYAGREHRCNTGEPAALYCDQCQAHYEGKPTDHLRAVHGHDIPATEPTWEEQNGSFFKKERLPKMTDFVSEPNGRTYKLCPDCQQPIRGHHKCKGAAVISLKPEPSLGVGIKTETIAAPERVEDFAKTYEDELQPKQPDQFAVNIGSKFTPCDTEFELQPIGPGQYSVVAKVGILEIEVGNGK